MVQVMSPRAKFDARVDAAEAKEFSDRLRDNDPVAKVKKVTTLYAREIFNAAKYGAKWYDHATDGFKGQSIVRVVNVFTHAEDGYSAIDNLNKLKIQFKEFMSETELRLIERVKIIFETAVSFLNDTAESILWFTKHTALFVATKAFSKKVDLVADVTLSIIFIRKSYHSLHHLSTWEDRTKAISNVALALIGIFATAADFGKYLIPGVGFTLLCTINLIAKIAKVYIVHRKDVENVQSDVQIAVAVLEDAQEGLSEEDQNILLVAQNILAQAA